MKIIKLLLFIFLKNLNSTYDGIIIGGGGYSRGIGGIGLNYLSCFFEEISDLKLGYISLEEFDEDLNLKNISIAQKTDLANVKLFTYLLAIKDGDIVKDLSSELIENSVIHCAVSMLECSYLPNFWVNILNSKFDMVIVPDDWLIKMYQNSGVNIPIFKLDLVVDYDGLIKHKIKKQPFIFGMVAGLLEDKNIDKVIVAYNDEFNNNDKFRLKIKVSGAKSFNPNLFKKIHDLAKNNKNIEILVENLDRHKYISFLNTFDCFVLPSRGEGFSITTREALFREIPCILPNHTAFKTFCDTECIHELKSFKEKINNYTCFGEFKAKKFDTNIIDISKAMRYVYDNFKLEKNKTLLAQNILINSTKEKIFLKLQTLFKPKNIELGNNNLLLESKIITNSKELYQKYLKFMVS